MQTLQEEYNSFVNSEDFLAENQLAGALAAGALLFTGLTAGVAKWVDNVSSTSIAAPRDSDKDLDLFGNPKETNADNLVMPMTPVRAVAPVTNVPIRAVRREEAVSTLPRSFREDWAYLTVTVWGEARGEGRAGMRGVAHVMMNRLREGRWGDRIKDVVTARRQFSCWEDENLDKMMEMFELDRRLVELLATNPRAYERELARVENNPDWIAWRRAKEISFRVLKGDFQDTTNGANHYHTTAIDPSWNDRMRETAVLGNHRFFRGR